MHYKRIQYGIVTHCISNALPGQQSLAGHSRQFARQSAAAVPNPKGEKYERWEVVKTKAEKRSKVMDMQKRGAK